jgi:hypothetical protein
MPPIDKPHRRAPRQSTEERRAMIVQAAVPLLVEIGPSVSTLQSPARPGSANRRSSARSRTRTSCWPPALPRSPIPRHVVDELAAIDLDSPLRDRLVALVEAVRAQGERTGAVVNAVSLAGSARPRRDEMSDDERARLSESRTASWARLQAAVAAVLEPDAARLRMPVTDVAALVLAIVMSLGRGGGRGAGAASVTTDGLVDLLLDGITA